MSTVSISAFRHAAQRVGQPVSRHKRLFIPGIILCALTVAGANLARAQSPERQALYLPSPGEATWQPNAASPPMVHGVQDANAQGAQNANYVPAASSTSGIQQVQVTNDPRRPLDARLTAMPRAEQKLEVIHHRSQLVVTRNPIRRIAWSDQRVIHVEQFSPTEIAILGLQTGTTDLTLWFDGQENPLMYVVTVIRDPSLDEQRKIDYGRIERRVALLYPNSKVYLIPMSRKVIVRGQAKDSKEAANIMQVIRGEVFAQEGGVYGNDDLAGTGPSGLAGLGGGGGYGGYGNDALGFLGNTNMQNSIIVDELQVPGEFQVQIRIRIAEINQSQLRRYGLDWSAIFNGGASTVTQAFATGGNPILTGVFSNGDITVLVDALASNGIAKVMNDARTITLSGESVAFLSGGEFAVPTIVGIGGAQGQQTSFRGFGTSIIATPTVVDDDLIRLQVVPELSSINNANAVGGIPGVNVSRVQTRVELREGQSIVLGGMFSRQEAAEVSRIPFLGEIPVVGTLMFNAKQATEDQKEMLIILTPEIVRPMDPEQVPPLPGWYSPHPDDIDFCKYNRIQGNPDLGHYQLLPFGNGQGYGQDVGYNFHNPAPATGQLNPQPGVGMNGGYGQVSPQQTEYGVSPGPAYDINGGAYGNGPSYNNPQGPSYQIPGTTGGMTPGPTYTPGPSYAPGQSFSPGTPYSPGPAMAPPASYPSNLQPTPAAAPSIQPTPAAGPMTRSGPAAGQVQQTSGQQKPTKTGFWGRR